MDIAGLVKGASKGEGLGNKFLANIRETDAIIHVLRCFDDENVTHVDGSINPVRDKEIIDYELQLKDLETIERILLNISIIEVSCSSRETLRIMPFFSLTSLQDEKNENNIQKIKRYFIVTILIFQMIECQNYHLTITILA